MIKLIAFDWNGTLLSDTAVAHKAGNQTFKVFGLKPISVQRFRETFQIPIKDMWIANGLKKEIDFQKQSHVYHEFYEGASMKTRTRAGSREVLEWLKNNGVKQMIYSNHVAPDIIKQLMRLNIFDYFDEVLARQAGDHSHVDARGKQQKLFEYIQKNNYKPQEVISVGDTAEEIQVGKKYGYYTVAITGGYNTTSILKKHHPDFLIHNMLELKKIIKKLNNL